MASKRKFKRVLFTGDQHCGHRSGLTPNGYESQIQGHKYKAIQMAFWKEYEDLIKSLKPIDVLVINGDIVDGEGKQTGGSELIAPDINTQIEMALASVEIVEAGTILMTYGTPYHVGTTVDYERAIAGRLGCEIQSQVDIDVNGLIINCRHFVTGSSVPYGQATQLAKSRLWNMLWAEFGEYPKADIIIRSHVHWYTSVEEDAWRSIALPALQGTGSKFGARRIDKRVNWGLVWIDVYDDGYHKVERYIVRPPAQRVSPIVV